MDSVHTFLKKIVFPKVKNGAFWHVMDYKSRLQELIQQENTGKLHYEIIEETGPAHAKQFKTSVQLDEKVLGTGEGSSKKEAEQEAARQALLQLKEQWIEEKIYMFLKRLEIAGLKSLSERVGDDFVTV